MRNLNHQLLHGNAETLVLALLAEGEGYGYQIRKDLANRSEQYFQFAFGRLYPLLRGLETRGLAKARWVKNRSVRRRKQYVITRKGLAALDDRKAKWSEFSKAMNKVLNKVD
jgi:PadR family transcriptional regulator, regulatory protein PadR